MATMKTSGIDGYIDMLDRMGAMTDSIVNKAVIAGRDVVARALKNANTAFAKYVKPTKPKRNSMGVFSKVQFVGETSSGERAGLAAAISEYGRQPGSYTDSKGVERSYPKQTARPWIRATVASVTAEAEKAMQAAVDEEVRRVCR